MAPLLFVLTRASRAAEAAWQRCFFTPARPANDGGACHERRLVACRKRLLKRDV